MVASPHDASAGRKVLRSLAGLLDRRDRVGTAVYVAASLGVALSGSVAALLLVPLVQPSQTAALAGGLFQLHGGADAQAVAFTIAMLVFALVRWYAARLGARLLASLGLGLRRRVHEHLLAAPVASLADASSAEIANVLTYNVEVIVQGYGALQQVLVAAITAVVSIAFAAWISPWILLAMPALLGLAIAVSRGVGREQSAVSRRYVRDMTDLFWHSEDFPRRLRHVRSFGREGAEQASHGAVSWRLGQGYRRQVSLIASGRLAMELMAALAVGAMFMLAHHWHGIDQAGLVAVCLLLGRLLPYLLLTRQSFQQWRSAVPAFELWQRYMQLGAATEVAIPASPAMIDGVIHIRHVRVTPPASGVTLAGLTLVPGQLTLVCGRSGVGKTSLSDVLAGMASPVEFLASVNGVAIDFDAYRELVRRGAYVSQQVRPWQRTVRQCLSWASPGATDAELARALRDVGLEQRLATSADGWDTTLDGPRARLSGGELQRVMLAQVILRQPRLAVLDEATSALDAASEMAVLAALVRCLPRTIILVVSHRPGVARLAAQCVFLDGVMARVEHAGTAITDRVDA